MFLYKPILFRLANVNRFWFPLQVLSPQWSIQNLNFFEDGDDIDDDEKEQNKETQEKKDDKDDDSSDDEGDGGKMIPVIEIIKGIFPRIFRPSAE
ncbi:hypothetical protein pb186bvf_011039 [Paramecium bursaria]